MYCNLVWIANCQIYQVHNCHSKSSWRALVSAGFTLAPFLSLILRANCGYIRVTLIKFAITPRSKFQHGKAKARLGNRELYFILFPNLNPEKQSIRSVRTGHIVGDHSRLVPNVKDRVRVDYGSGNRYVAVFPNRVFPYLFPILSFFCTIILTMKCPDCADLAFQSTAKLVEHMRMCHGGIALSIWGEDYQRNSIDQLFHCRFPGCDTALINAQNFQNHVRRKHKKNKPSESPNVTTNLATRTHHGGRSTREVSHPYAENSARGTRCGNFGCSTRGESIQVVCARIFFQVLRRPESLPYYSQPCLHTFLRCCQMTMSIENGLLSCARKPRTMRYPHLRLINQPMRRPRVHLTVCSTISFAIWNTECDNSKLHKHGKCSTVRA